MQNGLFKLDWGSVADALLLSVVLAVVGAFYGVVATNGGQSFDVFTADWGLIGKMMVNISFTTAVTSIAKDLLSTNAGSVLNITPANVVTPPQQ